MNNSVDGFDLIENCDDILETSGKFNRSEISRSKTQKLLNMFFHWYYLPNSDIFVPSKFLGYKRMDLFIYSDNKKKLDGRKTQLALKKYFIKLDRDSKEYNILLPKLKTFLESMDKDVSKKTTTGSGGIYIPKGGICTKLKSIKNY